MQQPLHNRLIASEIDGRVRSVDTSTIDFAVLIEILSIGIANMVHEGKLQTSDICVDS